MKIVKDCWDYMVADTCHYGAHLFDGENITIYVNSWLATGLDKELQEYFTKRNSMGYVGHCLLVFNKVRNFQMKVTRYTRIPKNDSTEVAIDVENLVGHQSKPKAYETVFQKPIYFNYSSEFKGICSTYFLSGSLNGIESSVDIEIEAQAFELHIIEKNDPVGNF